MSTIILIGGLVCVGLALFLLLASVGGLSPERTGADRSAALIAALTTAPDEMRRELEPSFMDRVVVPVLDQFQTTTRLLTPSDGVERLRAKLELAGNPPGVTVERLRGFKAVGLIFATIVAILLVLLFGAGLLLGLGIVVLGALLGYMAPNLWLHQKVYDRTEGLRAELADAIDLLTISVESGLAFDSACAQVARNTEGPLSGEFARMLQEMQLGKSRADALRGLAERSTLPDLRAFVGAMVQADAFGIPMGQVLRVQSSEMRVKKRQWAEEAAQKVPVKIMPPLIFLILPCLFIAVLGPAAISMMGGFSGRL